MSRSRAVAITHFHLVVAVVWGCSSPSTIRCEVEPFDLAPGAELFSSGAGPRAVAVAATIENQTSRELLFSAHETSDDVVSGFRAAEAPRYPWLDDTWIPARWSQSVLVSERLCREMSVYLDFGFRNPSSDPDRRLTAGRYPLNDEAYLLLSAGEMGMAEPEVEGDLVVTEVMEDERVSGHLDGAVTGWLWDPFGEHRVGWVDVHRFAFRGLPLQHTQPGRLEP